MTAQFHKYLAKTPEDYIKNRTADWDPPVNNCLDDPSLIERLMVAGGEFSCQTVPESVLWIMIAGFFFLATALLIIGVVVALLGIYGILGGVLLAYFFAYPLWGLLILPNALTTSDAEAAYRAEAFEAWKVEMTEEWQIKADQNKEIEMQLEKCKKKLRCRMGKWFKDTNLGKELDELGSTLGS